MKLSKTRLARTLLIHVYFGVIGRCIYGWLRCFDVTHCTCTYAHIHFISRSYAVSMLHVYPGQTLMFRFVGRNLLWARLEMLSRYLLTWLAISISRFTRSFSYPLLRCYTLPTRNLVVNLYKSFHTVIIVSDVTLLHLVYLRHGFRSVYSYDVTLLRCCDVMLLRCYDVTLLHRHCLFINPVASVCRYTWLLSCLAITILK